MSTPLQPKPRYELLDGLRGVAALMVIIYHVYECFPMETWLIGHGYLAVDFFFLLSGFVIGYAYDDRFSVQNPLRGFFKRRLIRLHPMVVFGVVWGLICFLLAGGSAWDGTKASLTSLILATLMGLFLIPALPGSAGDVRGNQEMFSLNGPHWSLFFEYIGNILYALLLHRFSTRVLALWTAALGGVFAWFFLSDAVGYGNVGVGWTLDGLNFWGGLLRMMFSYSLGLLMSRFCPRRWFCRQRRFCTGSLRFWLCSFLLVVFLSVPPIAVRDGSLLAAALGEGATANCLYEVFCILFVFPLIVWLGAAADRSDGASQYKTPLRGARAKANPLRGARAKANPLRGQNLLRLLGDISYPLYAVHYPTMYIFYAYIGYPNTFRTPQECWPWMLALIVGNILFAYAVLRLYDLPVRRWLARTLLYKPLSDGKSPDGN